MPLDVSHVNKFFGGPYEPRDASFQLEGGHPGAHRTTLLPLLSRIDRLFGMGKARGYGSDPGSKIAQLAGQACCVGDAGVEYPQSRSAFAGCLLPGVPHFS
ncbi:MAG: hypothetical protein ABSB94_01250 [Syntrophorhabdales bacterium]|jgi:hypothetical protein